MALFYLMQVQIQQRTAAPTADGSSITRNRQFAFTSCQKFHAKDTWQDLADTMELTIPRNTYVVFSDGTVETVSSTVGVDSLNKGIQNVNVNSFPGTYNKAPLFMRGDAITLRAGYTYPVGTQEDGNYTYASLSNDNLPVIFQGFISEVGSTTPLVLKCEDNMWQCKQIKTSDGVYEAGIDNMGDIFADFTAETGFEVQRAPSGNAFFQLNVGNFEVQNDTWGSIFDRLKKKHRLYFYFRGNVLRGGGIVYYPEDGQAGLGPNGINNLNTDGSYKTFIFQQNIIKDELKFQLKSDVNMGAVCYSMDKEQSVKNNAQGNPKTSTKRLQATVGAPKESATEYFTFFFRATTTQQLTDLGNKQLLKYYYDGFKGKLTTVGLPYVTHGNIVTIQDELLPERNGNYLVKAVERDFSEDGGFRQHIELHIRVNNLSPSDYSTGI